MPVNKYAITKFPNKQKNYMAPASLSSAAAVAPSIGGHASGTKSPRMDVACSSRPASHNHCYLCTPAKSTHTQPHLMSCSSFPVPVQPGTCTAECPPHTAPAQAAAAPAAEQHCLQPGCHLLLLLLPLLQAGLCCCCRLDLLCRSLHWPLLHSPLAAVHLAFADRCGHSA